MYTLLHHSNLHHAPDSFYNSRLVCYTKNTHDWYARIHCLEGEVVNEQENGDQFILEKGMSYVVTDGMSSHRSRAYRDVRLLIIDGDFLKQV